MKRQRKQNSIGILIQPRQLGTKHHVLLAPAQQRRPLAVAKQRSVASAAQVEVVEGLPVASERRQKPCCDIARKLNRQALAVDFASSQHNDEHHRKLAPEAPDAHIGDL